MNAYAKYFDKYDKCMNLSVNEKKKNTIKYGIKLKTYLGKGLIVNQYKMINTLKLREIHTIKTIHVIKHQQQVNLIHDFL